MTSQLSVPVRRIRKKTKWLEVNHRQPNQITTHQSVYTVVEKKWLWTPTCDTLHTLGDTLTSPGGFFSWSSHPQPRCSLHRRLHFFHPSRHYLEIGFDLLFVLLTSSKRNACLSDSATPFDFSAIISYCLRLCNIRAFEYFFHYIYSTVRATAGF